MAWRCRDCGQTYESPPETCTCGSPDVGPAAGGDDSTRFSLLAIRERLVAPDDADRSLVRSEPYVSLAFRVLVATAVLATVVLAVVSLV